MPKLLIALPAALAVVACGPVPYQAPLPEPPPSRTRGSADEAFGCAMRAVNMLHYEVLHADGAAGFLRARRGIGVRSFAEFVDFLIGTRNDLADILTITIYPSTTGSATIRALARTEEVRTRVDLPPRSFGASVRGDQDAHTILQTCGIAPDSTGSSSAGFGLVSPHRHDRVTARRLSAYLDRLLSNERADSTSRRFHSG